MMAGVIENWRDVARISGKKAARHLRSRVQRSGRTAALACSTSTRVAPGTDTSTCCDPSCRDGRLPAGMGVLSVRLSRRPETGRKRRRLGARPSLRWRSDSGHAGRPAAGAKSGEPGAAADGRVEVVGVRGPAAGRAAPRAARRSEGHAGSARRVAAASWSRLPRLRRGRNDSEMVGGPSAGCGPWVVAQGHPASRRPGRAEQTTARPASVRTCVKVRLTWRTGRRPAPQRAGRRQTGWQKRSYYGCCRSKPGSQSRSPSSS